MFDLIVFELKKIVCRRTTVVAIGVLLAHICFIMALNVLQTKTVTNSDEILSGFDAIAYNRDAANAHAGELTAERIVDDLTAYRDLTLSKMDVQELATMSDAAAYSLMTQAAGIAVGIAYVMTLGFAGLTLAISSRTKSTLAVFSIVAALILVSGMVPSAGSGILMHILYLAPANALAPQPLLDMCMSYPLGPVVLDLQGACWVLYGVIALVCVPLAVISFRRHQVA